MLFKDTKDGKEYKEEMDKKFHRKEVTLEELREKLNMLNHTQIRRLCNFSKEDLIELFLSNDPEDIDNILFMNLHNTHKFAFKLKLKEKLENETE